MYIMGVSSRTTKKGITTGTILVKDGNQKHRVKFEFGEGTYNGQWGANTDVLCYTWSTFERLMNGESLW